MAQRLAHPKRTIFKQYSTSMWNNYLQLAFRNLRKNPGYSAINLAGLALGTACCLYMLLYVRDQYSYDKHHQAADRIFRVVSDLSGIGDPLYTACVSPPIAPALAEDYGEVQQWTRLVNPPELSHHVLRAGDHTFYETRGYYVDSTFFKVFDYHFVSGSPEKCLDAPYTVVLTVPVAEKLFGAADKAVGQSVEVDNRFGKHHFQVTAVIDESLGKSHIDGHFYMAMNSGGIGEFVRQNRSFAAQNFVYGYVLLADKTQGPALAAKLPEFIHRRGGDQLKNMGMNKVLHLEALPDIHTESDRSGQLTPSVGGNFLRMLLLLAVFIQGIACINFVNLSTARATRRAKEVGVRKAIGARRTALISQFLSESMLLSTLAVFAAVPAVALGLPWLNRLTGAGVDISLLRDSQSWFLLLALAVVTGLAAGVYPAFYLSGFQPVKVLKGIFSMGKAHSAAGLRKGMVTAQFIIAITLIIGTLGVWQQFEYLSHASLGFEKEQKITIPFRTEEARAALGSFKNELRTLPEIQSAGTTTSRVCDPTLRDFGVYKKGGNAQQTQLLKTGVCDEDYLPTMKMPLLCGRNFLPADTSNQLILNETAVKALGWKPEEAIGDYVYASFQGEVNSFQIIGVVRDFHYSSLYHTIQPYGFLYSPAEGNQYAVISTTTGDVSALLPKIAGIWEKLLPSMPFEYDFLEAKLQVQYASDKTMAGIITTFALIALFISCLGLFGLATFAAEQRTKEIGIRKVLGASVAGISALLTGDFLKLVLLAMAIASPIGYYLVQQWLTDFAYRIDIQWWVFAVAGVVALLLALLTVGFQSLRAATVNPVKSLRSE